MDGPSQAEHMMEELEGTCLAETVMPSTKELER